MVDDPAFIAGEHSTKWVEEKLDLSGLDAAAGASGTAAPPAADEPEPRVRREVPVEVNGKRFSVTLWLPEGATAAAAGGTATRPRARRTAGAASAAGGTGAIAVPMQGTIVKVLVSEGDSVEAGQAVVVLEAMKMENNINADVTGTVKEIKVSPGDTVGGGDVVMVIEPA
jgi:acetyl-CoA/propionyl-CoA carboxylase biotin carboxyl carrier protein